MSQYSETVGSFVRTSNYPLEAYYIFPSEESLKEFYSDPIQATTIHKGLLKIVEDDGTGNQAIYWVTKKETNEELEFTKLITGSDVNILSENISRLQNILEQEIENRKSGDNALWGTDHPESIPDDLNSILDLSIALQDLLVKLTDLNEKLKEIIGTEEDDYMVYLESLQYSSLTEISLALDKFLNQIDTSNTLINTLVELNRFLEGYNDTQQLKTILENFRTSIIGDPAPSEEFRTFRAIEDFVRILKSTTEHDLRNLHIELDLTQTGIGLSSDGSFNPDAETNYLQDATSIMNALKILDFKIKEILSKKELEFVESSTISFNNRNSVVAADVKLSSDLKNLIIAKGLEGLYFNLKTEYTEGILTVKVNDTVVGLHDIGINSLVKDAYYDPTQECIVIKFDDDNILKINISSLIREWDVQNTSPVVLTRSVVTDGVDILSADINISTKNTNILKVDNNSLLVEGVSTNIKHNGIPISTILDNLTNDLNAEISKTSSELNTIKNSITTLETNLTQTIEEVELSLTNELTSTNEKVTNLLNGLSSETSRALSAELALLNALANEATLRKSSDDNINTIINALNSKVETLLQLINTTNANVTTIDNRLLLVQQQIENIILLQRAHGWYEE